MLTDKLRDGAHGKVFKILFWIIILSFVFAGVGNYLIPRLNTDPVQVGDIKITSAQWNSSYQDQVRSMQNRFGPAVNEMFEDPNTVKTLRMQVLERLIDNASLGSVTYNQGIRIGDAQVKDEIRHEKAFFKDGKFNNDLFLATVRNIGSSPDHFANQLRAQIAQDTIAQPILRAKSTVYPYEIDMLAKLFAQKRVVDIYTANLDKVRKTVSLSEEDVKKFYDENHSLFKTPATVQFSYIALSVDALKKDIEVTDEKLEEFYNLNQSDFEVPQKRQCSQILIKSTTKDFEAKGAEAIKELAEGKSFEEVGAKYSDSSDFKKNHGSLGALEKGSLSSALDIALFSIEKIGGYSKLIVDESGAHILRLDAINEAYTPDFAKIKNDVKNKFIDAKALELYNEKSATLTDVSYENPDSLDAAAKAIGEKVMDSGVISLGQTGLAWPLDTNEVQKAAFNETNRSSNQNSSVIQIGENACAVINVSDYHDASTIKFEDTKEKARELATEARVNQKAEEILGQIQKNVESGAKLSEEQSELVSLEAGKSITRSAEGYDPSFIYDVYSIVNNPNSSVLTKNKKSPVLVVLKNISLEGKDELDNYSKFIKTQLAQFKLEVSNSVIHMGARELSDIQYNEDAISLINQQNNATE